MIGNKLLINKAGRGKRGESRAQILSYQRYFAIPILFILLLVMILPLASAQISFCCEKTKYGAWCQNDARDSCDEGYKITPTACDSTSYCKRGCCFDSQEGLCMENTPEKVCEQSNGTWSDNAACKIAQCEYGCCILGDQAALVTMTRCKSLSSFYGLETDFRKDIVDELICIATANAQDKGACVFEDPESHSPTCKFTTRADCGAPEGTIAGDATAGNTTTGTTEKGFYNDILCTAPELKTICAKQKKTMLVDGRDEVYYKDTCGNPANIYDASKYDDKEYWRGVFTKSESCGAGQSNAKSKTCGNCDYFLGSIGKQASITTGNPTYGDYICADLGCKGHKHGESWCEKDPGAGNGGDRVGSRYFRQICVNNEILVEPCADFRNEICLESAEGGFSEAACVVNRWQDCIQQAEKEDCENIDKRECMWTEGYYFGSAGSAQGSGMSLGISIMKNRGKTSETKITPQGLCAPNYPPGFTFWGQEGSAVTSANKFSSTSAGSTTTAKTILGKVIATITGRAIGDTEDTTQNKDEAKTNEDEPEKESGSGLFGSKTESSAEKQKFNAGQPVFGTGAVAPKASVSPADSCSIGDISATVLFERTKKALNEKSDWECQGEAGGVHYKDTNAKKICDYFEKDKLANPEGFASEMNKICGAIGDCGKKPNWVGKETGDGYAVYWKGERVAGAGGPEVLPKEEESEKAGATGGAITGSTTGSVIADFFKEVYDKVSGGK